LALFFRGHTVVRDRRRFAEQSSQRMRSYRTPVTTPVRCSSAVDYSVLIEA